jgi:very-short-patch-repair endonuclease
LVQIISAGSAFSELYLVSHPEDIRKDTNVTWFISHLIPLIIVIAIAIRLLSTNKEFKEWLQTQTEKASFTYRRQPSLFSAAERSFLGVLEQASGADYKVFAKVRIADLMQPAFGARRQSALNRIVGKHVDFVLCDSRDLSVVGVIELDDKSHNQSNRQRRDAFVDKAFASAGIPIAHFPARAAYNIGSIRETLQEAFQLKLQEYAPAKVVTLCDFHDPSR